jgi:hypothetical protein
MTSAQNGDLYDVYRKSGHARVYLLRDAKLQTAIARAQHEAKHGSNTFVVNKHTGEEKEFKASP